MLAPIQVTDPRMNLRESTEKNRIVLNGGSIYSDYIAPADSNSSQNTGITINLSGKNAIDRNLLLRCYVEFVADQPFQIGTNDAPRAFPIASAIQTLETRINGASNSDSVSDRIHAH